MAAERFEIRIAGSGGQGVILATELIGQAITHYEPELYVVQSQAYGPEARGGKSKAEVVIYCVSFRYFIGSRLVKFVFSQIYEQN